MRQRLNTVLRIYFHDKYNHEFICWHLFVFMSIVCLLQNRILTQHISHVTINKSNPLKPFYRKVKISKIVFRNSCSRAFAEFSNRFLFQHITQTTDLVESWRRTRQIVDKIAYLRYKTYWIQPFPMSYPWDFRRRKVQYVMLFIHNVKHSLTYSWP